MIGRMIAACGAMMLPAGLALRKLRF